MDYTIIGGAMNLASRLESAAEPGKILITHDTWSLVKDAVVAKEMPPLAVKGFNHRCRLTNSWVFASQCPTKQFAAKRTV